MLQDSCFKDPSKCPGLQVQCVHFEMISSRAGVTEHRNTLLNGNHATLMDDGVISYS